VSPVEQAAALDLHAGMEASSLDHPLAGQPVWEMEMVIERKRGSPAEAFHSISSEEEPEEGEEGGEEDLKEPEDLRQGRGGEEEVGAAVPGYESVPVAAALADGLGKADEDPPLSHSAGLGAQPAPPVTPPMQVEEQSELFDPHTLQTVVTSCEIPDQRTTLEGSQVGDLVPCRDVERREMWCTSRKCMTPFPQKLQLLNSFLLSILVDPHHRAQLRGPGVRGHPAQYGRHKRGRSHLHRHRGRRLQPGV